MGAVQKLIITLTKTDGTKETFDLKALKELKITGKLNDHARIFFSGGHIKRSEKELYVLGMDSQTQITVEYIGAGTEPAPIFVGVMTHIELVEEPENQTYFMKFTGASYSCWLDALPYQRSFQNAAMTYDDLFAKVSQGYSSAVISSGIELKQGTPIGQFTLQYQESDWKLLKRLASRFQTGLVPNPIATKPSLTVGLPKGRPFEMKSPQILSIRKRVSKFRIAEANFNFKGIPGEYVYYRLRTNQLYLVGDTIEIPGILPTQLYVYLSRAFIEKGELYFETVVTPYGGLSQPPRYNRRLAGVTVEGSVIATGGPEGDPLHDKVKVKLNFDDATLPQEAAWFPYATCYSAEGHTGFYCLPEIGGFVKLYFPSSREEEAVVASSRRTFADSEPIEEINTKCLRASEQKELAVTPTEVTLKGKSKDLEIQFNQDTGVTISSPNQLEIRSQGNLLLQSSRKIRITAARAIVVKCGSKSGMVLNGEMVVGGKALSEMTYVYGKKMENDEGVTAGKQDKPKKPNNVVPPTQTKDWIEIAKQIIAENEGNYGSVNREDGLGTEKCPLSLSVGKIQWYAERAHDLLRKIKEKNPEQARKILAGTTIYEELDKSRSVFHNRPVSVKESNAISKLLLTSEGKTVQDQTIADDVPGYIQHGKSLGLTDKKVLAYFADLENQGGGGGSKRVVEAAGGANGLTLNKIHQTALKDSRLGTAMGHGSRRIKTYKKCVERLNF